MMKLSSYVKNMFTRATERRNQALTLERLESWDNYLDGKTDAGVTVNHKNALHYAPVWQAVSLISGDVARIPLQVKQWDDAHKYTELDRLHEAHTVVARRANREVSSFKFWRRYMLHALLWGNAYALIVRNGAGQVVELVNLLPDRTAVERKDGRLFYTTEVRDTETDTPRVVVLQPSDVLHVEGLSTDNLGGLDPVRAARNAWALGLANEKFASKFFENGARIGGILEVPSSFKKSAADNLEQGFRDSYSGTNNLLKTVVLRDGAKFHKTMFSPQEATSIELSEHAVANVARHFQLPPSKLGLSESTSYGSKSEDNRNYLDSTLAVWLAAIASECNVKLLSIAQQQTGSHYFEHNTEQLLQLNLLERMQAYEIGVRSKIWTPNNVLEKLGEPPREDGDAAVKMPGEESNDARYVQQRVRFSIGARGRKKAQNANAFLEWVDGGLRYHRDEFEQLSGGAPQNFIDDVLNELRTLAENTPAEKLVAAVDETLTKFERGL